MNILSNLPYFEVAIDKSGNLLQPVQVEAMLSYIAGGSIRDLFVISHGWNNDEAEARLLYERFFAQFCTTVKPRAVQELTGQRCAIVGILWPSKKFADSAETPRAALTAGSSQTIFAALDQLTAIVGPQGNAQIDRARALVPRIENDPAAQREFVDAVRFFLPNRQDNEEGVQHVFEKEGDALLQSLSMPVLVMGGGEGEPILSSIFGGIKGAVLRFLNFTTYYLMKNRSGLVGRTAVAATLERIQAASSVSRVHLIGHSFGARVVTSAAAVISQPAASMTLLQAAFSHNAFSPDFDATHQPGAFRNVITDRKITGPILISHSDKDMAVGLAYAIASRLALQTASAIGDASDPYGGLGRNGAQHTPEASDNDLQRVDYAYSFGATRITNLNANAIIQGHSDIVKPEIAYALVIAAGLVSD